MAHNAKSACDPHREWIEKQVRLGRNGVSIYQDLVERYRCNPYEICSAEKLECVLQDFPDLKICVPHLGFDETSAYQKLITQYQESLKKQKAIALKMLRSPTVQRPSILHTLNFAWNYKAPLALTLKERVNIILNPFKASPADIERFHLPPWLGPIHLLVRPIFVLSRRVKKTKGAN